MPAFIVKAVTLEISAFGMMRNAAAVNVKAY